MKRRRAKHATPKAKPRLSAEQIQKLSETLERAVMGQAAYLMSAMTPVLVRYMFSLPPLVEPQDDEVRH
jgi:hypothetical protein